MTEAVHYDPFIGATLDSQRHWSKARQCLPEQGSTASEAGSTGMIVAKLDDRIVGARLDN